MSGFLPPQHPRLVVRPPAGPDWRHEIKFDGYRMQLHVLRGRAVWFSRNGHDWTDRLADFDARGLAAGIYDGELVAVDDEGRPSFSVLRSAMGRRRRGGEAGELVFYAFDMLMARERDLRGCTLAERKVRLSLGLAKARDARIREVEPIEAGEGQPLLDAACAIGLDGVVSKRLDSPYRGGEPRPSTWVKAKCRVTQDVVIGGWEVDGARLVALLVGVHDDAGALRYVGSVGSGFTGRSGTELLARLRDLEADQSPFAGGPRPGRRYRWARPELVARVEIAEWTAGGMLRQPSYKGLHDDKAVADVVRDGS